MTDSVYDSWKIHPPCQEPTCYCHENCPYYDVCWPEEEDDDDDQDEEFEN